MKVVLVRAGADSTPDGGAWNPPVDSRTGVFAYVPIPEAREVRAGSERPYEHFEKAVAALGVTLPLALEERNAHLDPDFEQLTYGHPGARGRRIRELDRGDLVVFYSSLRDIVTPTSLVYGLIGLLVVEEIVEAGEVPSDRHDENAHTRRQPVDSAALIVRGQPAGSGRLERCIPMGEYRARGYRVLPSILRAWGGTSSKDGFVGRAPWGVSINDANAFGRWLESHDPVLRKRNN